MLRDRPNNLRLISEGRVSIPGNVVKRIPWISGRTTEFRCYILLLQVGRAVIVPTEESEPVRHLQEVIARLQAQGQSPHEWAAILPPEDLALRVLVTEARMTPPPPMWRLSVPRALYPLLDIQGDDARVYVFEAAKALELVSPQLMRRGIRPLSEMVFTNGEGAED